MSQSEPAASMSPAASSKAPGPFKGAEFKARAKNSASPETLMKIMRSHSRSLDAAMPSEDERVVERHSALMVDLVRASNRLTAKVLAQAAKLAYDSDSAAARSFAERLSAALTLCKTKKRQSTSMKKLSVSVQALSISVSIGIVQC